MAKNKLALFLTGLCCFALDSLLETPMMSPIGFSLIIISGIWFLVGHSKSSETGKTFTSRLKEGWKTTEKLESKEHMLEKKIMKEEKRERKLGKKQHKLTKKEYNLYETLVDNVKKQISSKNPLTYYLEVMTLVKKIDELLEEEKDYYREEFGEIADEQRKLRKTFELTKKSISKLKTSEKSAKFEKEIEKHLEKEEKIDQRIAHLDKKLFKFNELQKHLINKLVSYGEDIHKRLRSIQANQEQQKFEDSYKEVQGIKFILLNKEKTLQDKNNLITEEKHISKKIKHLDRKVRHISRKLGKEEKEAEEDVLAGEQLGLSLK